MVMVPLVVLLSLQSSNLLANGDFQAGPDGWSMTPEGTIAKEGSRSIVRFQIGSQPSNPWDVALRQTIADEIPENTPVTVSFEGRSRTSASISAMIERSTSPYDKYVQSEFTLGPKWARYELKGLLKERVLGGSAQFVLHLGKSPGEVELTNLNMNSPIIKRSSIQYPVAMIKNGSFDAGSSSWFTEGKNNPKTSIISTPVGGSKKAMSVDVNSEDQDPWNCQVGQLIEPPSTKGDVVYLRAWLRRTTPKAVAVSFVYEMNVAPHEKEIFETVTPTPQWQEFKIAVPNSKSFSEKSSQLKFFFVGKGTVEIGPVSMTNLGRADISKLETFSGAMQYEVDQNWKREANQRIEKFRKGRLMITFLDAKGKPLPAGTEVTLNQISSAFKFGTALPASRLLEKSEDGDKFRAVVKKLFNTVTYENDLKWNDSSVPSLFPNLIDPATAWLQQNKIQLRGHNLVWGSYRNLPTSINKELSVEDVWKRIDAHVRDYTSRMKGKVYLWDVVNEAVTETELWDRIGWDKFIEVYKIASQIDPKAELCYNDFNINTNDKHRAAAIARVKQLQKAGAKVTVFGDQSHLSAPGVAPKRLWEVWDEVHRETKLPIEITELDFSTRNDAFQASYIEDFYRAAFSHPHVDGVILWGFWEKSHWLANRGGHMINADWNWRPAMKVIDQLITKDWRTNATLKTNSQGKISIPAFFGSYEVKINGRMIRVQHAKAKNALTISMK
jgi:endo-1,4-beta-xylanase